MEGYERESAGDDDTQAVRPRTAPDQTPTSRRRSISILTHPVESHATHAGRDPEDTYGPSATGFQRRGKPPDRRPKQGCSPTCVTGFGRRVFAPMSRKRTRYARTTDGVYLGYQVLGDGPIDLVWQPDCPGNIDMEWDYRVVRGYLDAFSSFSRLILHDHRGVGLSSRNVPIPNLETRVADLVTVLDAVNASRPALVGWGSSAAVHSLMASTRPERVAAMVWMDATPRAMRAPDYPWGRTTEDLDAELEHLQMWGTEEYSRAIVEELARQGTSMPEDDARAFAKASRNACTPDVAIELTKMWAETDVRDVLPSVRVPSLFLSQPAMGDREQVKDTAARVPGAEYIEIDGIPFSPEVTDAMTETIRRFGRCPSHRGPRHRARHGPVHRHRGIHGTHVGSGRSTVEGTRREASRDRPRRAGPLARGRS